MSDPIKVVLLVEDDADTRRAMARLMGLSGLTVVVAATVAEAFEALEDEPSCILLDLDLPDGRGESVLRHVREQGLPIRVVVCTASGNQRRLATVLALLPDILLRKPVDFDDVLRACTG